MLIILDSILMMNGIAGIMSPPMDPIGTKQNAKTSSKAVVLVVVEEALSSLKM